jgi:hypothetical protein
MLNSTRDEAVIDHEIAELLWQIVKASHGYQLTI